MSQSFKELIGSLCALVKLEDPQHILHGGPIDVDGVVFSLIHDEASDPQHMWIYGDFGFAPLEDLASAYAKLLQRNYLTFESNGPVYSLSPHTGTVICMERVALDGISAGELASTLAYLAAQASAWQPLSIPKPDGSHIDPWLLLST
jgi:Tir chaperone protein (CesT) family